MLDGEQLRGIAARLDGKTVGIAHYVFHAGIRGAGRCYLADLFVDAEARRQGVAIAVIKWMASNGEEHGFPRPYRNTLEDAQARALYDQVGSSTEGSSSTPTCVTRTRSPRKQRPTVADVNDQTLTAFQHVRT